jgi:hypothetical protein
VAVGLAVAVGSGVALGGGGSVGGTAVGSGVGVSVGSVVGSAVEVSAPARIRVGEAAVGVAAGAQAANPSARMRIIPIDP